MKRDVYPELADHLIDNYVLTRINRDDNETMHNYKGQKLSSLRLAQQLKIQSVPGIVLLNSKGEYAMHLSGFIEEKALKPLLE
jgi:thioredoxin-related protein